MDLKKTKASKNVEDRTRGGFRGFLDSMNEAFGTGRYSPEARAEQELHEIMLNVTRMGPINKLAAEHHAENVRQNPSIPADLDLDEMVANWIRIAQEETTPKVNLRHQK